MSSRYHWHVLTVWTDPIIDRGKPVVDFSFGTHTPIVLTKKGNLHVVEFEELESDERYWLHVVYIPILNELLKGKRKLKSQPNRGYSNKIVSGDEAEKSVPKDYRFRIPVMRVAIVIGHFPRQDELDAEIRAKMGW